jgi:hypothetical protein
MTPRDQAAYDAAAKSVNVLIESFRATLVPIPTYDTRNPNIRNILLTHALVDTASIKLHWIFAYAYAASKQICLTAARNMVNYGDLNLQEIGHINPVMGVCPFTFFIILSILLINFLEPLDDGLPSLRRRNFAHASDEIPLVRNFYSRRRTHGKLSQWLEGSKLIFARQPSDACVN